MREIIVKLYKFEELTEKAKEKARDWFRAGYDGQFEWDYVREDAEEIGLKITELRPTGIQGDNHGEFVTTARECAEKVLKDHGDTCETFKDARAYLKEIDALELDEDGEYKDQDTADEITREFKRSLLEDYRVMLEEAHEYRNSAECIDEDMAANEYEFTEDGERA